jgi:hypothetical protein
LFVSNVKFGMVVDPNSPKPSTLFFPFPDESRWAELLSVFPKKPVTENTPALFHLMVTNDDGPADLDALTNLFKKAVPMGADVDLKKLDEDSRRRFLPNLTLGLFGDQGKAIDDSNDRLLIQLGGGSQLPFAPGLYLLQGQDAIDELHEISHKGGIHLHRKLEATA